MSVNPGFGGQSFIPYVLDKLRDSHAGKYDVRVTVEGGGPTGQAGAVSLGIARIGDSICTVFSIGKPCCWHACF